MSRQKHLGVRELAIFALLSTILLLGDVLMNWLPNVHFVAALVAAYTIVYRTRALIPIFLYTLLIGLYEGMGLWLIPYFYLWPMLWGVIMLLPRNMPKKVATPVYMGVCALHGLLFGVLYAPFQALMFGLDLRGTLTWIAWGFPNDALHALGNLVAGLVILPLSELLGRLERRSLR